MPDAGQILVSLTDVRKDYHALRPLRLKHLELRTADTVALLGFDQAAAETLVNLITGATLPDSGDILAFGRPTTGIADGDTWLRLLDQFGIITERAVLLDRYTIEQNLALPLSLELDELPDPVRVEVARIAGEVGISAGELRQPASGLRPLLRERLRLGRALALNPALLLAEHPNATLGVDDVSTFAADLARVTAGRGTAMLLLTADASFARTAARKVLTLNPATGELTASSGWRRLLGR